MSKVYLIYASSRGIVALYTPKFSSTNSKSSLTVLAINETLISLISRFEESPVKLSSSIGISIERVPSLKKILSSSISVSLIEADVTLNLIMKY